MDCRDEIPGAVFPALQARTQDPGIGLGPHREHRFLVLLAQLAGGHQSQGTGVQAAAHFRDDDALPRAGGVHRERVAIAGDESGRTITLTIVRDNDFGLARRGIFVVHLEYIL
jgi:hypothetical protein